MVLPFLEQVYESSSAAKMLADDLSKGDRVPLSLGVTDAFDKERMVKPIREVRMHIPGLEMRFEGGSDAALLKMLEIGELDLAVVDKSVTSEDNLRFEPIYDETMLVLTHQGSKLANLSQVHKADVVDQHFIGLSASPIHESFASTARLLDPQWMQQHKAARPVEAQIMALSGIGAALAGSNEPVMSGLLARDLADLQLQRTIGVATARGRRTSNAAQMLVRLLRSQSYERQLAG